MCLSYLTLICICPSLPLFLATHAVALLWVSWVARSTVQWVVSAGRRRREGGGGEAAGPAHPDGRRRLRGHQGSTPPHLHCSTRAPYPTPAPLHISNSPPAHHSLPQAVHSSRFLQIPATQLSISHHLNHYTHLQNV